MTQNQIREKFLSDHHSSFVHNICHFAASDGQKRTKVDDRIRPIRTILLIFDKMDIQVRPRIVPYLNHRTRTDLNVLLLRILNDHPRLAITHGLRDDPQSTIIHGSFKNDRGISV